MDGAVTEPAHAVTVPAYMCERLRVIAERQGTSVDALIQSMLATGAGQLERVGTLDMAVSSGS